MDTSRSISDVEYDRFGPWAVEITEEDPLPPLFLPYLTRSQEAFLSVKIPRKIERRNARPGMHLYDYLVNLYAEEVEVLERIEGDVQQHVFRYDDIQYICASEELLRGTLHLQMSDQDFDLPYNTVSKEVMGRVSCLIRQRYTNYSAQIDGIKEMSNGQDKLTYYFSGLLARLRKDNPRLRVLAVHRRKMIGKEERGLARRLFYGTVSKTLLESMHLSDGRELIVITRGRDYAYKWQSIYGLSTYTLPLNRIQGTSWKMDEKNAALTYLQLYLAGCRLRFVLEESNPAVHYYNNLLLAGARRAI